MSFIENKNQYSVDQVIWDYNIKMSVQKEINKRYKEFLNDICSNYQMFLSVFRFKSPASQLKDKNV